MNFFELDFPTKANVVLCILSFVLSLISIVGVLISLSQNKKMLENATRPYVCVYGESVNSGSPLFFIVVKNFGSSAAVMTKFEMTPDLSDCYTLKNVPRNYLSDLSCAVIAPGQSRICRLDYSKVPDVVDFNIQYTSPGRKHLYKEHFSTNIKAGSAMITPKVATEDEELRTISYTLQEMMQKNL